MEKAGDRQPGCWQDMRDHRQTEQQRLSVCHKHLPLLSSSTTMAKVRTMTIINVCTESTLAVRLWQDAEKEISLSSPMYKMLARWPLQNVGPVENGLNTGHFIFPDVLFFICTLFSVLQPMHCARFLRRLPASKLNKSDAYFIGGQSEHHRIWCTLGLRYHRHYLTQSPGDGRQEAK